MTKLLLAGDGTDDLDASICLVLIISGKSRDACERTSCGVACKNVDRTQGNDTHIVKCEPS